MTAPKSTSPAKPTPRVLVIPGLDGQTELWRSVATSVLPGLQPVWFDHSRDRAEGGLGGLAERALHALDSDAGGDAPAYICGESFGGPIALTLARRYPSRVRGLVLLSTFGWYPARLTGQLGLAAWHLLGDRLSTHILRLTHPLTVPGALGLRAPRHVARTYLRRPLVDSHAYRAKCELAVQFDSRRWLHEIRHRTLVLAGTSDPVVPVVAGQALARHLPDATYQSVTGGHLMWCIRTADVGARIVRWVEASERR
jgi:pimeloyl-ACP methyl ester carboxylesterase